MLSLAAVKFRSVLAAHGGPVQSIETGYFPVRGQRTVLANATLAPGLVRKGALSLYSAADGTGTDPVAAVARHILNQRRGAERYPCYITDLDLSRILGDGQAQTIHYLRYKAEFERWCAQSEDC